MYSGNAAVAPETIALSQLHRRLLDLQLGQVVTVTPFRTTESDIYLTTMRVDVDFLAKSKKGVFCCSIHRYCASVMCLLKAVIKGSVVSRSSCVPPFLFSLCLSSLTDLPLPSISLLLVFSHLLCYFLS